MNRYALFFMQPAAVLEIVVFVGAHNIDTVDKITVICCLLFWIN